MRTQTAYFLASINTKKLINRLPKAAHVCYYHNFDHNFDPVSCTVADDLPSTQVTVPKSLAGYLRSEMNSRVRQDYNCNFLI